MSINLFLPIIISVIASILITAVAVYAKRKSNLTNPEEGPSKQIINVDNYSENPDATELAFSKKEEPITILNKKHPNRCIKKYNNLFYYSNVLKIKKYNILSKNKNALLVEERFIDEDAAEETAKKHGSNVLINRQLDYYYIVYIIDLRFLKSSKIKKLLKSLEDQNIIIKGKDFKYKTYIKQKKNAEINHRQHSQKCDRKHLQCQKIRQSKWDISYSINCE